VQASLSEFCSALEDRDDKTILQSRNSRTRLNLAHGLSAAIKRLAAHGTFPPDLRVRIRLSREAQRPTLHAISSDPDSQEMIISALAALQANGLPVITVLVREKRKKARQVGVPIELFIETLTYVWDYRARFIEKQKDHGRDLSDSRVLWFSSKTKGPFQAKSIARAIGVVFHLAEMPGSGHRLRARYAIEQMREEIRLQLRDHGKVIDKHTILFIVAQRLGHANLQSLEYYLVDALHSLNAITDEIVHIEDTNVAARVRRLLDLIARKPGEVLDALDRLLEMQAEKLPPRHPRAAR
jgi:hypothetical protein